MKGLPYIKHPGGRPVKFSISQIEEIKKYRYEKKATYKEIAEVFDCSIGLVHSILKNK